MSNCYDTAEFLPTHENEARQHILFVDDEPNIVDRNRPFLERAGYLVSTAVSGKEALDILARTEIDLVVTDAMMPEMSGFELMKHIRDEPLLSHLPVIMMLYGASGPMTPEALRAEAAMSQDMVTPIIFKFFEPRDLVHKVKACLDFNRPQKCLVHTRS